MFYNGAVRGLPRSVRTASGGHAALEELKCSLQNYTTTDTLIGIPIALPRASNLPRAKPLLGLQAGSVHTDVRVLVNPDLVGDKVRYLVKQDL